MSSRVALIVAGGNGTRFGSALPKQYHAIADHISILDHTVAVFQEHSQIDLVCVVVGKNHEIEPSIPYTYSGKTRQESVRNGLRFLKQYDPEYVLIHDAVRPFVSHYLISKVVNALENYEAVDVGLPIVDTIKTYDGEIIPRESIYATQTPQGFHFQTILDLHEQAIGEYTDDISLYLDSGRKNFVLVAGDRQNIKITYKEDLL